MPEEIIVIDDGSTDENWLKAASVVHRHDSDRVPVKLIRETENWGPGTARNKGWEAAKQPFVAFLDADDEWHSEKLRIQHSVMELNPNLVLTSHDFGFGDFRDDFMEVATDRVRIEPLPLKKWLWKNRAAVPSVMLRRSSVHRFSNAKRYSEDFELWLRMAADGAGMARIPMRLARCFKPEYGHSGLSGDLAMMQGGELVAIYSALKPNPRLWVLIPPAVTWSLLKYLRRVYRIQVEPNFRTRR